MYLRPDEVARVLEKVGFTVDVVTQKAYGYRRGENYVYVNREARMGRTALVICNFAFFSGLIGAQFWAERAQPKSPELDAKLLVSC